MKKDRRIHRLTLLVMFSLALSAMVMLLTSLADASPAAHSNVLTADAVIHCIQSGESIRHTPEARLPGSVRPKPDAGK